MGVSPSCPKPQCCEKTLDCDHKEVRVELVAAFPARSSVWKNEFDEILVDEESDIHCPAGAIFSETREKLCASDRHLLFFSASTNVFAVKWLLQNGASWEARDTNWTTPLHAACRSGSVAVIQELLKHSALLNCQDVAGWTPLHVAATVGRCTVIKILLQAGAERIHRTRLGQSASDLCTSLAALAAFDARTAEAAEPDAVSQEAEQDEHGALDLVGFEPHFVPQPPVAEITEISNQAVLPIVNGIFNSEPGVGLAFGLAVGAISDFPYDIARYVTGSRGSRLKISDFFSFQGHSSRITGALLEMFNARNFIDTGIVSALMLVLDVIALPEDLERTARLLGAAACIWWRQHQNRNAKQGSEELLDEDIHIHGVPGCVTGLHLKGYLSNPEVLQQLMFSAFLLARCVQSGDSDGYTKTYEVISNAFQHDVPEYVLLDMFGGVPLLLPYLESSALGGCRSDNADEAVIEEIFFAIPQGLGSAWLQGIDAHEGWASELLMLPAPKFLSAMDRQTSVWLSLSRGLLFFSSSCDSAAPFAFLSIQGLEVSLVAAQRAAFQVSDKGPGSAFASVITRSSSGKCSTTGYCRSEHSSSMVPAFEVAFLLCDGSWQGVAVSTLELQFPSADAMEQWMRRWGPSEKNI